MIRAERKGKIVMDFKSFVQTSITEKEVCCVPYWLVVAGVMIK